MCAKLNVSLNGFNGDWVVQESRGVEMSGREGGGVIFYSSKQQTEILLFPKKPTDFGFPCTCICVNPEACNTANTVYCSKCFCTKEGNDASLSICL